MGANNSTRRVSFESDENDNVTVVKGIRLSEDVINRMREPSKAPRPQPVPPPPFDPIPTFPPPPAPPAPSQETVTPPPPLPPPPQPVQVEAPTIIDMVLPSASLPVDVPPAFEPTTTPPPAVEPVTIPFASPSDPPASAPFPASVDSVTPLSEPLSSPAFLSPESDPLSCLPVSEPVVILPTPSPQAELPAESEPSVPVQEASPVAPTIDEEALKKRISDELYEGLEKQRVKAEQDLQAWLEAEKSRASAQSQAEAKRHVEDEVARILSAERAVAQESIQQAVIRERIVSEDEKLRVQLYAKQLEAKEADLSKQDAFYREQVARLEERSAQFYKVTTENYHKAADQVNAKFKRYDTYPVCADLQGQILACYKENAGKTLHCSNIAAMYLQCVNNAKQPVGGALMQSFNNKESPSSAFCKQEGIRKEGVSPDAQDPPKKSPLAAN
nr:carbohydrate-responsive element-binding protein-like [Nerophis lumbriciformis]